MSIISEKVSYLRGLADGLKISEESNEGKLLLEILNVLGEIADDIEYIEDSQDELFDRVYDLEDEIYGEYGEYFDDDYEFLDDDEDFSIKCPNCQKEFVVSMIDLDDEGGIVCPNCHETMEFEFGCSCDNDDCDGC
ncbi:MAG: hypothetical protein PHF89_03030 [Eubacteriales bacterium]|jgi:DNA-directed RNA polymerase subunit RPC12/RpoP|nr:hypothetical protein [Eubacteriales bacterium]